LLLVAVDRLDRQQFVELLAEMEGLADHPQLLLAGRHNLLLQKVVGAAREVASMELVVPVEIQEIHLELLQPEVHVFQLPYAIQVQLPDVSQVAVAQAVWEMETRQL
jgi:hypothetical protein